MPTGVKKQHQTHRTTIEHVTKKTKKGHGFTLVELIIVIGIITLITVLAIVSVSSARMSARDTKRVADTRNTVLALESYYNNNNRYPETLTPGQTFEDSSGTVYMAQIPSNPNPRTDGFCPDKDFHYESLHDGKGYILTFCLGDNRNILHKGINFYQSGNSVISCGNSIIDRDGFSYQTVQIGSQCWLAENLRTKTKPDGTPLTNLAPFSERDCVNSGGRGSEVDCTTGNTIYTWEAFMNGSENEGVQGLCPDGWHVPTDSEWHDLESFLADSTPICDPLRVAGFECISAGTKLKPSGLSHFNGLLLGYRDFIDDFQDFNIDGLFWSSTKEDPGGGMPDNIIWTRKLNNNEDGVSRWDIHTSLPIIQAISGRCIKNY